MKASVIVVLGCLLAAMACTKLPLVNAPREKEGISLVQNAHYDAGSKIRYMVSNDNTHVYLRFDTDNFATIARIRKFGAIVHFDTEGKKKAPYWLKYPVYDADNGSQMPVQDDDMEQGGRFGRNLFPPSTTTIWHTDTETRAIDLGINPEGFVCKAGLDSMDVLVYLVGVPIKLLGATRPEELRDLRILLEIPVAASDDKPSGSDMSATGGVPGGSSMGSTMPGSNNSNSSSMNSGMPGMGGMGNSPMPTRSSSSGPSATRIWMEVKLSPSAAE